MTSAAAAGSLALLALLAGCAPLASLRPASGIPLPHDAEAGAALVHISPRPYVDEEDAYIGQVWFSMEPSRRWGVSAIAAFDSNAFAGGLAGRWNALRTSRVAIGTELELGYAWGAASVGFALRAIGENYVYFSPRFGNLGYDWTPGLPAGVSIDLTHGFVLRAEAQVSWADFKYYNRRLHLASGLVYQW